MIEFLDLENCVTLNVEAQNIQVISNAFKHLEPIEQFMVGNYRIDLYLQKAKISIECDEFGHKNYNQVKDGFRQQEITKKLGCNWIRFNPNSEDFCIGNVINDIIKIAIAP